MLEKFLVGGYTKRDSKGIYSFLLDTDKEELLDLQLVTQINGATYLTLDQKQHLYAVATDNGQGGTRAFFFDGSIATPLNSVTAPGASNCYVAVDEARDLVYAANYHLGEVRVYKRSSDGQILLTDTVKHEDHHGPKPEQKGALCHFSNLTPDQRLAVCDLGNDAVYTYAVSTDGKLSDEKIYQSRAGSGDRHLAFSPDGKYAYLACELDSTVEVLAYQDGTFSLLQKITTLPDQHTGFNGVAAIRLSADGKFLYVSNRGHDSIITYTVINDGSALEIQGWTDTKGNIPRDFNFNHTEDFLIVAHQDSDNLSLFKRNPSTGQLTLLQDDFYAPEGTCVLPI